MGKVRVELSVSLDGYVAGPEPTLQAPLGKGGEGLHEWLTRLASWKERHGQAGGESDPDSELVAETTASVGATVMGRRMFSGGEGPWETDPNADAWFGDEPPFGHPVFVLTHHERKPVTKANGTIYHFVTDGIESAVAQARQAAGDRDVTIAGGADVAQQALRAGLVDEVLVHLAPLFLGAGTRLFDGMNPAPLTCTRQQASTSGVAHLWFTP
jgi:dihydrofolate reductase